MTLWKRRKKNPTKPTWSWFPARRERGTEAGRGRVTRQRQRRIGLALSAFCGACVWALIKDRRFFKHIRAILSNCFTPSSISTRTKDTDCSTKRCSPSLLCSITLSRPQRRHKHARTRGIMLLCSARSSGSLSCNILSLWGQMKKWHTKAKETKGPPCTVVSSFQLANMIYFKVIIGNQTMYIRWRVLTKADCNILLIHWVAAALIGAVTDAAAVPKTHFCSPRCRKNPKQHMHFICNHPPSSNPPNSKSRGLARTKLHFNVHREEENDSVSILGKSAEPRPASHHTLE